MTGLNLDIKSIVFAIKKYAPTVTLYFKKDKAYTAAYTYGENDQPVFIGWLMEEDIRSLYDRGVITKEDLERNNG